MSSTAAPRPSRSPTPRSTARCAATPSTGSTPTSPPPSSIASCARAAGSSSPGCRTTTTTGRTTRELWPLLRPLWERSSHPGIIEGRRGEALEHHAGFAPVRRAEIAFEDALDRDGMLAWFASFSVIGALPDDERAVMLGRIAEILDRIGAGDGPFRRQWRADLWLTRRI